ncbi:hypothetical protein JYK14_18790 [Siccirubricoccus sp. KC 17139]|uniref:LPS-assembly lipoprotein LptE n=1 Tax=Siccirubricoccus soli TaxID=2899147 RepID=A0ABT1DAC9_9PROT|nr:hypothetical protein [Siccirubricoccus soli]MCO6418195.1 hypothetical protein [Siccirubricoccus soli]MCP2684330.1 hypothetical protein [Siccirubricoccus soli]
MPHRRSLLLPVLAAACSRDPAPVPATPIGYRYLIPLPLTVSEIEISTANPAPAPGDVGARLVPSPAEAVRIMGRDRLVAVGTEGKAVFSVATAQLIQGRESLSCTLACRLEVLSPMGSRMGYVEAATRRAVSGPDAERRRADEALLRQALDDLNVEFEFQVRRNLREFLAATAPNPDGTIPAPPPAPVEREALPRE